MLRVSVPTTEKVVRWANWTLYLDYDEDSKKYPTLEAFQKESGFKATYAEDIEDNDSFYGKVSGLTDSADTTKPVKGTSIGLTADVDYDHVIDVTAPPSVTFMVPVTTGGQRPFGIEAFQSSPSVSPAPARTIPVSASRLRIAARRVSSTTGPAAFNAASPYERPAPRKTGVSPRSRQLARTAASSCTDVGRWTGDTQKLYRPKPSTRSGTGGSTAVTGAPCA